MLFLILPALIPSLSSKSSEVGHLAVMLCSFKHDGQSRHARGVAVPNSVIALLYDALL